MFGHKYAASLESQKEITNNQDMSTSHKSSEISAVISQSNQVAQDEFTNKKGAIDAKNMKDLETIRTLSTCEESKKYQKQIISYIGCTKD